MGFIISLYMYRWEVCVGYVATLACRWKRGRVCVEEKSLPPVALEILRASQRSECPRRRRWESATGPQLTTTVTKFCLYWSYPHSCFCRRPPPAPRGVATSCRSTDGVGGGSEVCVCACVCVAIVFWPLRPLPFMRSRATRFVLCLTHTCLSHAVFFFLSEFRIVTSRYV